MSTLAVKESFKERILAARRKAALSQAEAARQWGFSPSLLSRWESGQRFPCGLYKEKLEHVLARLEKGF